MPDVVAEKHFAIVPEWVVFHPTLSANAVRVYAVLARYANSGGKAWPSYASIGRHCSFTARTAKRAVQELIEAGAVTKRNRTGPDGAPTSNLYVVMTTEPGGTSAGGGDTPDTTGDTTDTSGDTGDPRGGDTDVPGVGSEMSHEREPLNERKKTLPDQGPADTGVTHQQIVDRLVAVCGLTLPLTKSEAGRVAKAAKGIRPVVASLDDIDAKAAAYRRRWPGISLTATALESNWSQVDADTGGSNNPTASAVALARSWSGLPWDDVEARLLGDGEPQQVIDAAREAWDLEQQAGAA